MYWLERIIASEVFGIKLTRIDYVGGIRLFWQGDGMTWFLLSMLLVKTLFSIFNIYISDLFAFIAFSLSLWLAYLFPQYEILYYLQWGIFFCLGYIMNKFNLEKKRKSIIYFCSINVFLIGIDRYILCGLDMFVKVFIGTSVFVMFMCVRKIPKIKSLELCGQNSMVIYIIHGLLHYFSYYFLAEIICIKNYFVLLCFMIVLQLLIICMVVLLYTKVNCLHWIQILFYPYKYVVQKSTKKQGN